MNKYEIAVFTEVNEHMRCTEQKQLSISIAFFGVVAVVLSVLSNENGKLLSPSPINFFIYGLLIIIGCIVFALQRWYRAWKEHYIIVVQKTIKNWEVPGCYCPAWMISTDNSKNPLIGVPKADNLNIYFTCLLNTFLMVFGLYRWLQWWEYSSGSYVSVAILFFLYLSFLWWVNYQTVSAQHGKNA